jgi:hypothetical protein
MPTPGPSPEALRQAGAAADQNESQEPVGAVKQPRDRRWIEVKVVNDRGAPKPRRTRAVSASTTPLA